MDYNLVNEGLKLIEEASCILESISNNPGVTATQFLAALDSSGILIPEMRSVLLEAATTIELSLDSVEDTNPTVH
jgi:uncharacterized protein (UPF0147 family)